MPCVLRMGKLAAVLTVGMAMGCGPRSAPPTSGNEAAIRRVLEQQVTAWNQADLAGFMEGYAKSDTTRFASGGSVNVGWQKVFDRYQSRYTNAAAMGRLTFSGVTVESLGADAALAFGEWRLERMNDSPSGLFTLLFRLTPEGWRIFHDHTSSAER